MQPLTILVTVAFVVVGMTLIAASSPQEGETASHPEAVRTQPIPQPLPVEPLPPTHEAATPEEQATEDQKANPAK